MDGRDNEQKHNVVARGAQTSISRESRFDHEIVKFLQTGTRHNVDGTSHVANKIGRLATEALEHESDQDMARLSR
ncbi:hypothetical protein LBMAG48_30620 [Phycisphaerae bacterium]|nr:hypothetical protein LBMAG48_30620 [Phycisphaerae bacterium]